ncbi:hypothetical protein L195_g030704, partial [Trifolium pratense]
VMDFSASAHVLIADATGVLRQRPR